MEHPVTIVRVKGIAKSFDSKLIFENLNLDIREDEIVAIIGPSGCGKSTLLRMIAGLESVDVGKIEFTQKSENAVGYVFQRPILYPHLNVEGNVSLGIDGRVSKKERKEIISEELRLVGLDGFSTRSIESLSGGEAQRVTVVRALLNQPALLLLDEPFSALDIPTRRRIAQDTREILKSKRTAAIHVTHDPEEAEVIADRVLNWKELTFLTSEEE
ncbi:MAG: ATP-binding cassette domain-containing protein [Candidatus Poseidoniaceae archaeon]|nr:ATP-binding cassette domain-containing protein [Candidatus Poseidoniaceae archaeon]